MKIFPVKFQDFKNNSSIKNNQKNTTQVINQKSSFGLYDTSLRYLAFKGGASLDLARTYETLKDDECPPDIKESMGKELDFGNPLNKTLYDIHFDKYRSLLDCYSIDEVIEKYPEFDTLVEAKKLPQAAKGSFIDNWLSGDSQIFPQDEDLTLQLVKLYWGQGLSRTDLENYTAQKLNSPKGYSLGYVMNKLGIPMMSRHYACILKLSDKQYNERFTTQMSIKLKEASEAREQKEQGEPVVIPKGPLSEAHKKHISQSLIEYYAKHPQDIYAMSQRQKKFYEDHPEEKEKLSKVSYYAWNNTKEGKALKVSLSKYAKKQKTKLPKEISEITDDKNNKNNILINYLKINPNASQMLSEAMKKAWADMTSILTCFNGKTIPDYKISFNTIDTVSRNKMLSWLKEQGYYIPVDNFAISVIWKDGAHEFSPAAEEYSKEVNKMISAYDVHHQKECDLTASVRQLAIIILKSYIESKAKEEKDSNSPETKYQCLDKSSDSTLKETPVYEQKGNRSKYPLAGIQSETLENVIADIMSLALNLGCLETAEVLNNALDEAYSALTQNDVRKIRMITT